MLFVFEAEWGNQQRVYIDLLYVFVAGWGNQQRLCKDLIDVFLYRQRGVTNNEYILNIPITLFDHFARKNSAYTKTPDPVWK